jgi:hypothetical protein
MKNYPIEKPGNSKKPGFWDTPVKKPGNSKKPGFWGIPKNRVSPDTEYLTGSLGKAL